MKPAVSRVPTEVWGMILEQQVVDMGVSFDTVCTQEQSFYKTINFQDLTLRQFSEWVDQLTLLSDVCCSWREWVQLRAPRFIIDWRPVGRKSTPSALMYHHN